MSQPEREARLEAELDVAAGMLEGARNRYEKAEAQVEQLTRERERDKHSIDQLRREWRIDRKRMKAAEQREAELREAVEVELGRHLCYTSEYSRQRFWKQVDARLSEQTKPEETGNS